MVGYPMKTKWYRIYLPAEKNVMETINVSFGNRVFYNTSRRKDGKNSGINLDPSFSEPPAKSVVKTGKETQPEANQARLVKTPIPRPFQEAMNSSDSRSWKEAMDEEISAMKKMKTRSLIPRPDKVQVIGCKWVYTNTKDEASFSLTRV
ncbi:hypothetical protein TNCV_2196331 [Trichonephila clavipes]|nr:hypothetical protein TNCV_2196331 [Trichonephila clavipes]